MKDLAQRMKPGDSPSDVIIEPVAPSHTKPPLAITAEEWTQARPTPLCIVESYLFADVAGFIAPGGMGKTTLQLFESVHIALGLPLYGLTVYSPGPVVILTAEDSREMLVARLRAIAEEMNLTPAQIQTVRERVRIWDVSGEGFKLTEVDRDVVRPGENIDRIIEACKELRPVLIVVDPAVSFGVGESRVNDAEQGLIEAARKLRTDLGCCVRYVHHTGKANARDKAVDQYAGRGGSAFADGARMVAVLQSLSPSEWFKRTGQELAPGETGLVLARPKLSYAPPAGEILIRRTGYTFQHVNATAQDPAAELHRDSETILALVGDLVGRGQYPSKNTLEGVDTGLSRLRLRNVLAHLQEHGDLISTPIPNPPPRGARTYLAPRSDGEARKSSRTAPPGNSVPASPPPIGITPAAKRPSGVSPPYPRFAGEERRSDGEAAKRESPTTWEDGL